MTRWAVKLLARHPAVTASVLAIFICIFGLGLTAALAQPASPAPPSWTAEGNEIYVSLGQCVATAGDVNGDGYSDVIVCAWSGVFVYHGSASGLATSPAWQGATSTVAATAGDVNGDGYSDIIVGFPDSDLGQTDEGKVSVYLGSAAGLAATASWTVGGIQVNALFGCSVGTAGDVNRDGFSDVIIGAQYYDDSDPNEGAAFVYHGSATGLAAAPSVILECNRQGAFFGCSVGTAGDVNGDGYADVIVGASNYGNGQGGEGAAFVYLGSASGIAASTVWSAESDQIGASMGNAVATAGDVNGDGYADVIIGAYQYDNGQNNEGVAFLYLGSATGLGPSSSWSAEINELGGGFGISLGTAGDVNGDGYADVVVGAPGYGNIFPLIDEGAALVYLGQPGGLATTPRWLSLGGQLGADCGRSVATAGDVNGDGFSDVIVGVPLHDSPLEDEGRALVYHGAAAGLSNSPAQILSSTNGVSAAPAGDVNGDGFSDIIAGDISAGPGGRAFVYYGSPTGLPLLPAWTKDGDPNDAFGSLVAGAGDVNGDGYSDVIVTFRRYVTADAIGYVQVFYGSPVGIGPSPAWTASGQPSAEFGNAVASAGDVNGDGFSDIIVGAYHHPGHPWKGRVFMYYGSRLGLPASPSWSVGTDTGGAEFGFSVGTAGDVNGDGFSDVIIGAQGEGSAYVHYGAAAGPDTIPDWTKRPTATEYFGHSVATAGDVNGDGFSDVILGVPAYTHDVESEGAAFVYHGSAAGLDTIPAWIREGDDQYHAYLGEVVSCVGDVNGDGFSDIAVGSYFFYNPEPDEGVVFVHTGSQSGLAAAPAWLGEGGQASASYGSVVASAGDVNGDGFSDIMVRAQSSHQLYVYHGNGGSGVSRIARQGRVDGATPICPLSLADVPGSFLLKALGRSAAGRDRVRLQFEVKPAGVPFDGTGLVTGPAADTGVPASGSKVPLSWPATGFPPGTVLHWRLRTVGDSPFFPRSPWLWQPWNALTEGDLRTRGSVTGVSETPSPSRPVLAAAPNPFASLTQFTFNLPRGGRCRLTVYDVQGRKVSVLADGIQPAGRHAVPWDGKDGRGHELASGVYFFRFEAEDFVESRKIVIAR